MRYLLFAFLSVGSLLSAADFFPLYPGNHWTLRNAQGGKLEMRVSPTLLSQDDQTYYRVFGYRSEGTWVRTDERGDLLFIDQENDKVDLLTRFRTGTGAYRSRLGACEQTAYVDEKRVEWKNLSALKIRYEGGCPDNAITEELYVENIGLVRRVVSTFIGPVTYNLVDAKVGKISYTEQDGASFEMSMPSSTIKSDGGDAATTITLRLQNRNFESVRLLFSSGQQYDFKLFDTEGRLVWQWSTGRFFTAGLSDERVIDRSWEVPVLFVGVNPGVYTLEGALTNSGPYRFATSATVRIN